MTDPAPVAYALLLSTAIFVSVSAFTSPLAAIVFSSILGGVLGVVIALAARGL